MAKKPKIEYRVLVRTYPGAKFVSLWIVRIDGGASSGLLWGELAPQAVEGVLEALGLPVDREDSPWAAEATTAPGCVPVAKQGELF